MKIDTAPARADGEIWQFVSQNVGKISRLEK